jgi:hypothetical protein
LEQQMGRRNELSGMVDSVEGYCRRVGKALTGATFEQKRRLVELLIDRVIATEAGVEIRYVIPTSGAVDETGQAASLQTVANLRATTGMFGAGYLEMLACQMTEELQRIRDTIGRGETKELTAKGVRFGKLTLTCSSESAAPPATSRACRSTGRAGSTPSRTPSTRPATSAAGRRAT